MAPTRRGWIALLMTALALASAGASGNNLLYLLYGALAAALALSGMAGWLTLRLLRVGLEAEGPAARGSEAPLRLRAENPCPWPCYGLTASWGARAARLSWIPAGGAAHATLRVRLPHRGLNVLEGLELSGAFPFGLWRGRRRLAVGPLLAWPAQRPARDLSELEAATRPGGRPSPLKGAGEEIHGLRELAPDDDARRIHWKLTAKVGRPIVAEYGALRDHRLVVTVPPGAEGDERLIEEAASACRFALDAGGEAALEAGPASVGFGRGQPHLEKILRALARLGTGASPRPAPAEGRPASAAADVRALRILTLAGAALVFLAVGLIDDASARLAWLGLPVLAAAVWVQRRDRRLAPRWVWTLLSLAVLIWTAAFDWRLTGVAVANVHLVGYLICYRLLSPITEEDAGQALLILFLGFFLASGLTISLWYFAVFIVFGLLAGAWLAVSAGAAPRRELAAPLCAAGLAGLALAGAFFVLTPRGDRLRRMSPLLAAGIDKLSVQPFSVTGFTDTVSLGWFGQLKKSSARVMRVSPTGWGNGRPGSLYVRGSAFDSFDGRHWTRTETGRVWAQRRSGGLLFPIPAPRGPSPAVEFTIYPMNLNALFTVGTPWMIEGEGDAVSFDADDAIRSAAPYLGGARYREYFNPASKGLSSEAPGYEKFARRRFLSTPPDPGGRTAALARLAAGAASSPREKVLAVERFLRRRYSYSGYSDGKDSGLDDFLFRSRRGNCEYFASAEAVLLRHLDVPTRLATGFLADEWNEYGRFFDVRQNEAHAWVEAFIPGRGWVQSDPTPVEGLLSASADAFGQRMERWLDAAQTEWYRHVIGYDHYVQNDALRRLSGLWSAARWSALARKLYVPAPAIALLALLAAGAARLRRRLKRAPAGLFARAQALLERAGIRRAAGATPREFARQVERLKPELASPLDALVELHYLACYSLAGISPAQQDQAARLLKDLRARL